MLSKPYQDRRDVWFVTGGAILIGGAGAGAALKFVQGEVRKRAGARVEFHQHARKRVDARVESHQEV